MRFLFLLIFIPVFALDFEFGIERIYKLNPSDFNIKDGILTIDEEFSKIKNQCNKSLQTQFSKLIIDAKLNYYYHTNKFLHYTQDLMELKLRDKKYIVNIQNLKNKDLKNCFLIFKQVEQKKMKTKSSAILMNLDNLDSSIDGKMYFVCLNNKDYIN